MKSLIEQKFNKLTVVSFSHKNNERELVWNCICECGEEKQITGTNLRTGKVKSCGCLIGSGSILGTEALKIKTELKYKNLIGTLINNCKILDYYYQSKKYKAKVECFCGKKFDTYFSKLFNKKIVSCGCQNSHKRPYNLNEDAIFIGLYRRYKKNAKKRNINFELNIDIIKVITQKNCYHCGEEPNNNYKHNYQKEIKNFKYNGIDRFDNNIGYVKENIVPCCKLCNRMKSDLEEQEFLKQVSKIYNHNVDKIK